MKRVMVMGSAGSGKSTLAKAIAKKLKAPLLHMDGIYWLPGWVKNSDTDFERKLNAFCKKAVWVTDGNYSRLSALRVQRADTLIFIDLPRWLCFWRIFKRSLRVAGKEREDLAAGCPDKVDWEFIKWVWNWRTGNRPKVFKIANENPHLLFIHLTSPCAVANFLRSVA
ncbi:MAG: AAA family ATPase [Proteobacteria bacterium]|nr:AAA family ATPase [Pseudomonadota bacterium]